MEKNIWEWINNLTKGLQKVADESQLNYRQIHAYIDGHDQIILDKVRDTGNYVSSENGTLYQICVDNDGNLSTKKVGDS